MNMRAKLICALYDTSLDKSYQTKVSFFETT